MSCKFNSELLVAAFWTDPCVFGFSPGEFPFPRYFPGGKSLFPPRISQFPKRETGPARQFLRGRNAGLQDLFFVSNGRTRYPIMTLISIKSSVIISSVYSWLLYLALVALTFMFFICLIFII